MNFVINSVRKQTSPKHMIKYVAFWEKMNK